MARKRSPYEIEPSNSNVTRTIGGDLGRVTLKKQKKKLCHSSSASENNEAMLASDAERDAMSAVDAKLAALAAGGSSHPISTKKRVGFDEGVGDAAPAKQQQVRFCICLHSACGFGAFTLWGVLLIVWH